MEMLVRLSFLGKNTNQIIGIINAFGKQTFTTGVWRILALGAKVPYSW